MEVSYQGNIGKLSAIIVRDFKIQEENEILNVQHLEDLKDKLEKIVAYLLDHDFERLLNAMYRLDIDEDRFKEAFTGQAGGSVSRKIAELILEREIRKVNTRMKYSGH